jgi:GT2 family glycosyltransferase
VAVDNGSSDDSVAFTRENFPEVRIFSLPDNMGYCMAYNLTMPQAFKDGCDWVVWANNDTVVEPGCFAELARTASSDTRIGVLGPCFLGWENDEPNYYMKGRHPDAIPAMQGGSTVPVDVDWVEGSFLMVSRRCVEGVGPLDPLLFFSWEEADFCRRARFRGWRVVLVPRALARHYNGGSHAADADRDTVWNRRASRNFYIYCMANPQQNFIKNILDTGRLFLVLSKAGSSAKCASIFREMKILANVLSMTPAIYSKWRRDRAGGHPPNVA